MQKIDAFLQTNKFLLLVVTLAMLNNLEHSANVYYSISKHTFGIEWLDWTHAALVVLIIDLAIIAFVVNGRHLEAGLYGVAICIINLVYSDGINMFFMEPLAMGEKINQGVAKVIYSIMFTYSIYIFSKMYFEKQQKSTAYADAMHKVSSLQAELMQVRAEGKQEVSSLKAELALAYAESEQKQSRLDAMMEKVKELKQTYHAQEEIFEKSREQHDAELVQILSRNKNMEAALQELQDLPEKLKTALNELELVRNELQKHTDRLTCKDCNYIAETDYALNAHKKSCVKAKELKMELV
jgi:hypothetical protein